MERKGKEEKGKGEKRKEKKGKVQTSGGVRSLVWGS